MAQRLRLLGTAPGRLLSWVFRDRSATLLLAQLSVAAVAMLANILASRTLMASGRGQLALCLQIAYLGSLGVVLGTDRSLVAVYSGARVRDVARTQVHLLVRPAVVALALGVMAVWALPAAGLGSYRLSAAVIALFTVSNAFVRSTRAIAIAARRQHDFLIATLVEQFLLLLTLIALAAAHVEAVAAWVAAYLLTCLGPAAGYLFRWARDGAPAEATEDGVVPGDGRHERKRRVRREGLQLLPSSLANTGMLRLDRLLLPGMASAAALGHYSAVSTFTELLTWPLLAYADNRTGTWRLRHEAGGLAVRGPLCGAAGFAMAGALATALVTGLLVPLLGPGFADARELIPPLVAAAAVLGLGQVVTALLVARRRNAWASASDSSGFVVSLVAYVTLIPSHGASGAAWGSLIGYTASLGVGATALLASRTGRGVRLRRPVHAGRLAGPARSVRGTFAGFALVLVALTGRYTLDRAGYTSLDWLDLRVVGLVGACALVAADLRLCGGLKGRQPAGWIVAALLFFAYQALSTAWAPQGAQIGAGAVDLLTLAVLTLAMYLHGRTWPGIAERRALWLLWVAGVVFGLGALGITGPGEQGRYAAFGGGPNVFVRVEALGIVAVVALVATGATRQLLWSLPLLTTGVLLSGSRGGLLAAVAVATVAGLAGRGRAGRIALGSICVAGVALFAAYRMNLPGTELVRSRFIEQTLQEGYTSDRPTIFMATVRLAAEHPFGGVGIDGFRVLEGSRLGVEYAHNYLLSVAAEGGTIGLVLLMTSLILWCRTMLRARPWSPLTKALVAAAGFVALASMASGDYYDSRFAWCCAALAAAGTARSCPPEPAVRPAGSLTPGAALPGARQAAPMGAR